MVVDRRIASQSSNNIQDNANYEMMLQLEGPIVDSFYDLSLLSWHNEMKPPLPCLNGPALNGAFPSFEEVFSKDVLDERGQLRDSLGHQASQSTAAKSEGINNVQPAGSQGQHDNPSSGPELLSNTVKMGSRLDLPQYEGDSPHFDDDIAGEVLKS